MGTRGEVEPREKTAVAVLALLCCGSAVSAAPDQALRAGFHCSLRLGSYPGYNSTPPPVLTWEVSHPDLEALEVQARLLVWGCKSLIPPLQGLGGRLGTAGAGDTGFQGQELQAAPKTVFKRHYPPHQCGKWCFRGLENSPSRISLKL